MGRMDERVDRRHDARALAWITVTRELEAARDLAIVLARRAGTIARKSFGQELAIERKGERGDLVTEADLQAEHLIVEELRRWFPNHGIVAEESGRHGPESEWVWWVDPLDGTNNLVIGLPLYGVCVTLCRSNEPLLAVIHDSHQGTTCWAIKGYGAFNGNGPLRAPHHARADSETTVSWLQGYEVTQADEFPRRIRSALETRFKRVLQTWAPSIDWALLAQGMIGAVVSYRNGEEDLIGGMLLAAEVGYRVVDSRTEST